MVTNEALIRWYRTRFPGFLMQSERFRLLKCSPGSLDYSAERLRRTSNFFRWVARRLNSTKLLRNSVKSFFLRAKEKFVRNDLSLAPLQSLYLKQQFG
jgi:hypothetical protein